MCCKGRPNIFSYSQGNFQIDVTFFSMCPRFRNKNTDSQRAYFGSVNLLKFQNSLKDRKIVKKFISAICHYDVILLMVFDL